MSPHDAYMRFVESKLEGHPWLQWLAAITLVASFTFPPIMLIVLVWEDFAKLEDEAREHRARMKEHKP